jgi:hypothetical protein
MLIGSARVSTDDQHLDLQRDAPQAAGCERIFEDTVNGAKSERTASYGVGDLDLGLAAHFTGHMKSAFWFVAVSMFASGALLWWLGEEPIRV